MSEFSLLKENTVWRGCGNIEGVIKDIGLENLLYCRGMNIYRYITDDPECIKERRILFKDMTDIPELPLMISDSLEKLGVIEELSKLSCEIEDNETNLYAIKEVETYIELVESLSEYADKISDMVKSENLKSFCNAVKDTASSEEYIALCNAAKELSYSVKAVHSITLGVNLDAKLLPYEAGIVSVNEEFYHAGDLLTKFMRMEFADSPMNTLAPMDVVGKKLTAQERHVLAKSLNGALQKMLGSSLRGWRRMMHSYFTAGVKPLMHLKDDLTFLKRGYEIICEMRELRLPICFPEVAEKGERSFKAKELYNPIVASALIDRKPIPNDIEFDKNGDFYILTGPNQGGKSVFLKSLGIAQIMFQLGLPIASLSARMSPVDAIYIHFPVKDENSARNGRFADECERMQAIAKNVTSESFVLMDESFSGSAADEVSGIAEEVLRAFAMIGCRGVFSTHLHRLSDSVKNMNTDGMISKFDNLVMQMEDGKPTYRVERQVPAGSSYAHLIAEKYGLSAEAIFKSRGMDVQ